jgi:fructooligosaccharide transport system substrate-binding protein
MLKKFFPFFILLVVASLILSACGSPATASPAAPSTESPSAAVETQPSQAQPVNLSFWIPGGRGRDEGVAAIVKAYEALHSNVTITVNSIPFNEFYNTLTIALAGDQPPDAALINGVEIQGYGYQGALLPLDDIFTDQDRSDFMKDLVDMVTYDGKMYGAPFEQAGNAMFYNKDYFEAAGVKVPQTLDQAWTWPEFVKNVKTVMDYEATQGKQIWGMIGLNNPIQSTFFSWTIVRSFSAPGSPLWEGISPDLTTVSGYIDTPEAMDAYKFWQSLYTDKFCPKDNVPDAFGTGLAATYFAIPPTSADLQKSFPDLNWGVMPIPYMKTPLTHTGSFAPGVSAKTKHPAEAKAFVKFFASADGVKAYNTATPIITGRKSLQSVLPQLQSDYMKLIMDEIVKEGVARPGGPAHGIFNQVIAQKMMIDIALGGDIQQTVANAVAEADAQLAQFKK